MYVCAEVSRLIIIEVFSFMALPVIAIKNGVQRSGGTICLG
jgi:hypothetical protein